MNFRRILSKSSLRSSSSSGKSLSQADELARLQSEIESLKQTVESLKVSLESRDAAIGTLAREKEKLYVELKSAQRTNRNLHQQLVDERDIHSKEKEYLIEEIKRLSKTDDYEHAINHDKCIVDDQSIHSFQEEIKAKDEIIYNICAKYLKIKSSKKNLKAKLEKIQRQSEQTCENIVLLLQDNRRALDYLLEKLLKTSTMTADSKKYIRLLKVNANLHFENTQLKVFLSQKDFPDCIDQLEKDQNHGDFSTLSPIIKRVTKDKPRKFNVKAHESLHSRLRKARDPTTFQTFKNMHEVLSPHTRLKMRRANSDSCLVFREV